MLLILGSVSVGVWVEFLSNFSELGASVMPASVVRRRLGADDPSCPLDGITTPTARGLMQRLMLLVSSSSLHNTINGERSMHATGWTGRRFRE
ncbi:hypothetical protein V6N11_062656 [Hibiscus sabdariffa]|uniref:Secreted protein n=1 Tax=Hibiscus sabdariffa TaxID=183260 RepID=A0ABR2PTI6_9ROSI